MSTPPEPVLRGRLTWLRAPEREDVPTFVRWMNDYGTGQFVNTRAPQGSEQEERWFERVIAEQGGSRWFFVICRLEDDRPVGMIDLMQVDLTNGNAGVGITIGEAADQGRGYGTDALETLLDFGFGRLRLERIWLDVYDFNLRAMRAYDKAGFTREGVGREAAYRDGKFVDVVDMAILRDEWAARRAADPFPGSWPQAPGPS